MRHSMHSRSSGVFARHCGVPVGNSSNSSVASCFYSITNGPSSATGIPIGGPGAFLLVAAYFYPAVLLPGSGLWNASRYRNESNSKVKVQCIESLLGRSASRANRTLTLDSTLDSPLRYERVFVPTAKT